MILPMNHTLFNACMVCSSTGVAQAIEQGADVNAMNGYALRILSHKGDVHCMRLLVEHGADIHVDHDYPIRYSTRNDHINCVRYLITLGADIEALCEPLYRAAYYGHVGILHLLLNHGAKLRMSAIQSCRSLDCALVLLQHGADINAFPSQIRHASIGLGNVMYTRLEEVLNVTHAHETVRVYIGY